ncbi:hypothetical protein GCM10025867_35060 [Frondihabitans sucicola]|uniref:DUF2970 domain-containing protein n=1 Tax=Frondihabitans sucicola TaxID=1268041 RepID=A0ABM8GSH8_9MICO|nr:hypothetical protein GCM10025867_35060 [Frondihabitans sucicola]
MATNTIRFIPPACPFGRGRVRSRRTRCDHGPFDERNDDVVVALWVFIGIIALVGLVLAVAAFVALAKQ